MQTTPRSPRQPKPVLRGLARAVSWHRRKLAVLAAVLAVLTGVNAAAPRPPDSVSVLRATEQLAGGARIDPGQVRVEALPVAAVPDGALTDVAQAAGRLAAAAIPSGQVITELDLVGDHDLRPGRALIPVRLADPALAAVLRPGESVDLLAVGAESGPAVVARQARVISLPAAPDTGRSDPGTGVFVLVEVEADSALALAGAAATAALTAIWSGTGS